MMGYVSEKEYLSICSLATYRPQSRVTVYPPGKMPVCRSRASRIFNQDGKEKLIHYLSEWKRGNIPRTRLLCALIIPEDNYIQLSYLYHDILLVIDEFD